MLKRWFVGFVVGAAGLLISACGKNEPHHSATSFREYPESAATGAAVTSGGESAGSLVEVAPQAGSPAQANDARARETPTPADTSDDSRPSREPDVIYVPTPQPVVDEMLELADVKMGDVVYDLGCGDGRIVVTAAKRYGVRAYGFDIDPVRVAEARQNVRNNNVEHLVTIEQRDIFRLDLSPADVVTLYLLPQLNVKLIPQLSKLKPGARIVSHDFDMAGVTPLKRVSSKPSESDRSHDIYLWHAPIRQNGSSQRR